MELTLCLWVLCTSDAWSASTLAVEHMEMECSEVMLPYVRCKGLLACAAKAIGSIPSVL